MSDSGLVRKVTQSISNTGTPVATAAVTFVSSIVGILMRDSDIKTDLIKFIVDAGSVILLALFAAGIIRFINMNSRKAMLLQIIIPVAALLTAPWGAIAYSKVVYGEDLFSIPSSSSISKSTPSNSTDNLPTYYTEKNVAGGKIWVQFKGNNGIYWLEYQNVKYEDGVKTSAQSYTFRQVKVDQMNGSYYLYLYDDARSMWFFFPVDGGTYHWYDENGYNSSSEVVAHKDNDIFPISIQMPFSSHYERH